jgi:hypothetical protein
MPFKHIPGHVPAGHKWCFGCDQALTVQSFDRDRSKQDGCASRCRRCVRRRERDRGRRKAAFASLRVSLGGR